MAGLITLLLALAIALYLCWLMVQPFVNVILWAAVLSVVFYPLHRRISMRVAQPSAAAALSTLLVIVLILLPVSFITVAVVRELSDAAQNLHLGVERISLSGSTIPGLRWVLEWLQQYVDIDPVAARQFIVGAAAGLGLRAGQQHAVVVGGAVGAVVQMALVVFTMFYLFRDGERIRHAAYDMLPLERVQMHDITVRTREVIAATIYGVLVIPRSRARSARSSSWCWACRRRCSGAW